MIKKKGLLLVISGPSGAGKGTVCKELLKRNPDFKLSVQVNMSIYLHTILKRL